MTSERELLELRPIKQKFEETIAQSRESMEKTLKSDTEKSKLQSKIQDLETELSLYKHDNQELEKKSKEY